MVARVTLAEFDTLRMSTDAAVELYRESVVPELQRQPGYAGVYVLANPHGKLLTMTFWESDEAAEAGIASGYYAAQVEKFVTYFRAPPGRETYDVAIAEVPMPAPDR
jgi:heme-degrading monooxygenase HmoA